MKVFVITKTTKIDSDFTGNGKTEILAVSDSMNIAYDIAMEDGYNNSDNTFYLNKELYGKDDCNIYIYAIVEKELIAYS